MIAKIQSRRGVLLLSLSTGILTALIGNIVSIEIIFDLLQVHEFDNPRILQYLGRISISFALVVWLSVFIALFVGRQRDIEAKKKAAKVLEEIYVHKPTSLINARWLDQVIIQNADPLNGNQLKVPAVKLYVIAWWPQIIQYFSDKDRDLLVKQVIDRDLKNNYSKNLIGYLGYGVFFVCRLGQIPPSNSINIKEIELNGKHVYLSSFETIIEAETNSYRLVAFARNMEQKIERGIGATEITHNSTKSLSSDSASAWHALERGDVSFVFQPIHSLKDHRIVSFEILTRLKSKDGTSIPITDHVASVLENSPLSIYFHRLLLSELKAFQNAINAVSACISISINVPAPILTRRSFWETLEREIEEGLKMNLIAFELTERTLPARSVEIESAIAKLNSLGTEIHLDDFGAGQSSVETISNYRFSMVKIDRSFIHSTKWDISKSTSLVNFLKSYTPSVLAEGIEDLETVDLFKAAGADLVQGFAFSRPLEKNAALERLRIDRTA